MPDDDLMRVLHALRLVGFGDAEAVAERSGVEAERARPLLVTASAEGWVLRRDGHFSGWSLTAVGRSRSQQWLADELARAGVGPVVDAGYRRFRPLNRAFLDLCTEWQLRTTPTGERVVNDHGDSAYDAAVVERLAELDRRVQPLIGELAGAVARFGHYGPRLGAARRLVEQGDHDWFTRPVIDSYHTVWFELHEDLLATLGLERTSEH